jgi:hypothetical protein
VTGPARAPRIVVESGGGPLHAAVREVVFGARSCDVVLDDPMVADRHCAVLCDDGFAVRDLGSVTGTWVDGQPARPSAAVGDGARIVIGASRLVARIEQRDGLATLVLDLQRNVFWWKRAGKGAFDNDPDALVRSEVEFGRFRALQLGNRIAMVLGLVVLLAATFVTSVMAPLADPGPLLPAHGLVAEIAAGAASPHAGFDRSVQLAADQGCDVCHAAGTPASKCLQCHVDMNGAATKETWRHPYVGDGVLGAVPGIASGEAFCSVCHRDHQGSGFLKPVAEGLVGKCEACHDDLAAASDEQRDAARRARIDQAPAVAVAAERQRPYPTYRFPHDVHLSEQLTGAGLRCEVCHTIDPAMQAAFAAGATDPDRDDFAEVRFEVCKSCHVTPSAPVNMSAAQQAQWRSKKQWPVTWHGTDEGGKYCLRCHAATPRGEVTPALRTISRPRFSPEQHGTERAQYVAPGRAHRDEFAAHANDQACTTCHLRGSVPEAEPPLRTFWHALHLAEGALAPALGKGGDVSADAEQGCLSCHADMRTADALRGADQGAYQWPAGEPAQAACTRCHREGERQLALQPAPSTVGPERRAAGAHFPHDLHVGSASFGKADTALAEGCFSCHEFAAGGAAATELVPRTRPAAADCTQCHTGHDHIAQRSCLECHPAIAGRSNSFLQSALAAPASADRPLPPAPLRAWPGRSRFSHLSQGHTGEACAQCHVESFAGATTLATVPVPDEAKTAACRQCHLQEQFHWR